MKPPPLRQDLHGSFSQARLSPHLALGMTKISFCSEKPLVLSMPETYQLFIELVKKFSKIPPSSRLRGPSRRNQLLLLGFMKASKSTQKSPMVCTKVVLSAHLSSNELLLPVGIVQPAIRVIAKGIPCHVKEDGLHCVSLYYLG